jgi:hypothetical protein
LHVLNTTIRFGIHAVFWPTCRAHIHKSPQLLWSLFAPAKHPKHGTAKGTNRLCPALRVGGGAGHQTHAPNERKAVPESPLASSLAVPRSVMGSQPRHAVASKAVSSQTNTHPAIVAKRKATMTAGSKAAFWSVAAATPPATHKTPDPTLQPAAPADQPGFGLVGCL